MFLKQAALVASAACLGYVVFAILAIVNQRTQGRAKSSLSIAEALARLRKAIGDPPFSICLDVWSFGGRPNPEVAFVVWDNRNHYQGSTLLEAVEKAEAANKPHVDGDPEAADALITEAETLNAK